jgi:hypothetical protein
MPQAVSGATADGRAAQRTKRAIAKRSVFVCGQVAADAANPRTNKSTDLLRGEGLFFKGHLLQAMLLQQL